MFHLPTTTGGHIADLSGTTSPVAIAAHATKDAAKKYHAIVARADSGLETFHQGQSLVEAIQDAKAAKAAYIARVGGAADPGEVARLDAAIAREEEALKAFDRRTSPMVAVDHANKATANALTSYLKRTRGKKLVDVPADVRNGGDPAELSGKLADFDSAVRETQAAPMPEADAIELVRARVESEAARGAPRAAMDIESFGNPMRPVERFALSFHFPSEPIAAQSLHGSEPLSVFDGAAAMCWTFRDQVIAKLEADVRAFYAGYTGDVFAEPERRKRIAELKAERAMVERQLAQAIWDAISAGDDRAVFPEGLSPEAILGVAVA